MKTEKNAGQTAQPAAGAEAQRLREDAAREKNWKRWGPYLAERQWGTVREDYSADGRMLDLLPARPCAQPRLPLGRGWAAGDHGPRMPALLRARPVERTRPDPQRAVVRLERRRGQPRRGREGGVFLPRLDPHPLLFQGALQVSAGRVSLRAARGRKPTPHPRRP